MIYQKTIFSVTNPKLLYIHAPFLKINMVNKQSIKKEARKQKQLIKEKKRFKILLIPEIIALIILIALRIRKEISSEGLPSPGAAFSLFQMAAVFLVLYGIILIMFYRKLK